MCEIRNIIDFHFGTQPIHFQLILIPSSLLVYSAYILNIRTLNRIEFV